LDDLGDTVSSKRVNFMLRLPSALAHDVKDLAFQRGMSANSMATALLKYGINATTEKVTLADRLHAMGVK
jgi:hypothetical protein